MEKINGYSDKSMRVLICTNYCTLVILSVKSDWSALVQNLSERSIVLFSLFLLYQIILLLDLKIHVCQQELVTVANDKNNLR
jgi:hypothetical protein